jgi:hypothetical protein
VSEPLLNIACFRRVDSGSFGTRLKIIAREKDLAGKLDTFLLALALHLNLVVFKLLNSSASVVS